MTWRDWVIIGLGICTLMALAVLATVLRVVLVLRMVLR